MYSWKNVPMAPAMFALQQLRGPAGRGWTCAQWAPTVTAARRVRVGLVCGEGHLPQAMLEELTDDPHIELAVRAGSLREGLALRAMSDFDVLLVEFQLQDGSGIELIAHLHGMGDAPQAIVMAWFDDEEAVLRAFEAGAAGWLVLGDVCGNLALSVLNVAHGGAALSPMLARRLMRRSALPGAVAASPPITLGALTDRERDVLAQLARGLRNKEIARRLAISDETVNAHLKSIYRKMHVHNRTQVVSIASRAGIL